MAVSGSGAYPTSASTRFAFNAANRPGADEMLINTASRSPSPPRLSNSRTKSPANPPISFTAMVFPFKLAMRAVNGLSGLSANSSRNPFQDHQEVRKAGQ